MTTVTESVRRVKVSRNYDHIAWKWMRYSAMLLIPLVGIHIVLQDVIVGVHSMDLNYVAERWANIFWRAFDALLLGFTMAHGINGLRQVLNDFIQGERTRKIVSWGLFIFWLAITAFGAIALIGGVRQDFPLN
ncbi:MAG: succinate dehydrogenase/fumarate reductase transmembrane subunit [Bellilinea sp.]